MAKSYFYLDYLRDPVNGEFLRQAVIDRLQIPGQYREDVLDDLEELRAFLAEEDLTGEDVALAVMDQVVGWCRPDQSLKALGESRPVSPVSEL